MIRIVSYPKSGRTWLRMLISKVMYDYANITNERLLYDISKLCVKARVPIIVFSHDQSRIDHKAIHYSKIKFDHKKYCEGKVLFMCREPKDVIVSSYFHSTERAHYFSGSISEYLRDEKRGIKKLLFFYKSWFNNMKGINSLLVRYEDLHDDPVEILVTVMLYCGLKVDKKLISNAIQFSSFSNMRDMELRDVAKKTFLRTTNKDNPQAFKVREGRVGGHLKYLCKEDIDYINEEMHKCNCGFYNV